MYTSQVIKLNIFGAVISVVIADDLNQVNQKLGLVVGRIPDCIGFTDFSNGRGIVFFRSDACAGVMAHESLHIVNMLFDWIEYKRGKNDEIECYLLGYLVKKIEKIFKKHKQKKNDKNNRRKEAKGNKARGTTGTTPISE